MLRRAEEIRLRGRYVRERRRSVWGVARRILLVTGNRGKLEEAREVLGEYGVEVEQAQAWKLEVQSESLEEIALQAARIAYAQLRRPLAVEDAGLFINALNGFPGPYSSYAYKTIGIPGVLRLLEGAADRRGCFRAAVAYIAPLVERVFTGEVCGSIAREPRLPGVRVRPDIHPRRLHQDLRRAGAGC